MVEVVEVVADAGGVTRSLAFPKLALKLERNCVSNKFLAPEALAPTGGPGSWWG